VAQHAQYRIAARQVGMGAVGTPDRPGAGRFPQHVKSRGVVDLTVHQHDGAERRVSKRPVRLQLRGSQELRADIRRGVHQHPAGRIQAGDGDRGLSARRRLQGSGSMPGAVGAIAVPLRKTAPGGRPQHTDFHGGTLKRACPPARAGALSTYQRLATYMVISMPNRNSTACGVSHFMTDPLEQVRSHGGGTLPPTNPHTHETTLMIFMSHPVPGPAGGGEASSASPGTMRE